MLKDLSLEVFTHPPYFPDFAISDFYLFRSMSHALVEQHFKTYEDLQKWVPIWFACKQEKFFWDSIIKLPERWGKCVANNGYFLNKIFLMYILKLMFFKKNRIIYRHIQYIYKKIYKKNRQIEIQIFIYSIENLKMSYDQLLHFDA